MQLIVTMMYKLAIFASVGIAWSKSVIEPVLEGCNGCGDFCASSDDCEAGLCPDCLLGICAPGDAQKKAIKNEPECNGCGDLLADWQSSSFS